MTATTEIRATHLVRVHAMAARLSPGYDTLAERLAAIRAGLSASEPVVRERMSA